MRVLGGLFSENEMEGNGDVQRRALQEAFGESSDSEGESLLSLDAAFFSGRDERRLSWESVQGVAGLWLCRDFLSENHHSLLLSAIEREGWFAQDSHNQAMRFGDLPEWATELARSVRAAVCFGEIVFGVGREITAEDQYMEELCPLPLDLLWREPLFDQLIVNIYKPGEGICAHVDLMRFEDGIAIISMESDCVMLFTRLQRSSTSETEECEGDSSMRIPVLLKPGSLILMSGEARYLWKHEIDRRPGFQMWEGKEIHQKRRTSITLRKLCQTSESNLS